MTAVAAIVMGTRSDATPPPGVDETIVAPRAGELTQAAEQARAGLLWLIDSRAKVSPGTLAPLLAAAPAPAASLPLDDGGRPDEFLLGGFGDGDIDALLAALGEARVPLRHIAPVSLLVAREDVLALAPPDEGRFGAYAGLEWSARLFARRNGFLVPASTVVVGDRARPPAPMIAARLVRSGAWRRTDALRPLRLAVNRRLDRGSHP